MSAVLFLSFEFGGQSWRPEEKLICTMVYGDYWSCDLQCIIWLFYSESKLNHPPVLTCYKNLSS